MKKLLILLALPLLSGCLPFHNMIDTALKQEEGWNLSGYIIRDKTSETKIGSISSELLYDRCMIGDRREEEALKEEGFVFGILFKKTF